jgi:Zn-dependent M28 family amino/carboxypeptidase
MKYFCLLSLSTFCFFTFAQEGPKVCVPNVKIEDVGNCVSSSGAMTHLEAFERIAEENDGNRSAGTDGHKGSAHYIAAKLLDAGYEVKFKEFAFKQFEKLSPGVLKVTAPTPKEYEDEKDFNVMPFSGSGNFTGQFQGVDLDLGPDNKSTSGCEAEDFEGFKAGSIAVVQRGACSFSQKAENALTAGASAVIIFNQGNTEERKVLFSGTLGVDTKAKLPVLATGYDLATTLLATADATLNIATETTVENKKSFNVIAQTPSGDDSNVVMIGSHLDSVHEGAGINDNGSGSAAILEVALKMKNVIVKNKIRYAWWSAEELGLVGSTRYVESLTPEEISKIALYLNFDMVASPNYLLGVFDADGSKFGQSAPPGSQTIEKLLQMFFETKGLKSTDVEISGRSDYAAFAEKNIPFGGTFTGAEGVKTEEEAILYGGTAGEAYDPCYHKECDGLDNISEEALELNVDAIAAMALTFGHSVESVKQERLNHTEEKEKLTNQFM